MPTASRPRFAGAYGVPEEEEGMLPWSWAAERLAKAHNYWVVTDGPHASPVWALWRNGALVFSCSPKSRKGRAIARNPQVVVHLESGAEVVIVEGKVEPAKADASLLDEYERKYNFRADPAEGWYRVEPQRVLAWTEEGYPKSATRFDF